MTRGNNVGAPCASLSDRFERFVSNIKCKNISFFNQNGTEEMVNHNYIINFFHFEANNISTSHFDLSPCFSDDNSEELAFDIANKGKPQLR